jgi:hypothetical protein
MESSEDPLSPSCRSGNKRTRVVDSFRAEQHKVPSAQPWYRRAISRVEEGSGLVRGFSFAAERRAAALPFEDDAFPFQDDAFAAVDRDDDILLSNNSVIFVCGYQTAVGVHTLSNASADMERETSCFYKLRET